MAKLDLKKINADIAALRKELGLMSKKPFLSNELKEANKELTKLKKQLQDANSDLSYFSTSLKNSLEEITKSNYALTLTKQAFKGLVSIADQFNQVTQDGVLLDDKKLEKLKQQKKFHLANLEYALRFGDLSKANREEIEGQVKAIKDQEKGLDVAIAKAEKFQKAVKGDTGVQGFGFLAGLADKIPGMSNLTSMFEDASKAATDAAVQNQQNIDYEKDLFALKDKNRKQDEAALESGENLNAEAIERLGLTDKMMGKDGKVVTGAAGAKMAKSRGIKPEALAEGIPKKMNTMMAGLKSLGPQLTKALGPLALIAEFVMGLLEADKQVTQIQKTMMMTKTEARGFNSNLQQAARSSGNISVTGTKVFETFMSLTKEAGFVAKYSMDTLGSATKLQAVLGVSASSTSNLAQAAEATGTSLEENYKSTLGASYEMQRQAGTQLDMKGILEETGQVTGTIRANMGGNTVEIAKAVTQAKLLGTNLEAVANAGRQMLDFESSINKEMEAELMTGRQLNLDRARAAALAGDQETVAKELAKNMGDFTEFSKMNVLQQEALAGAMGMQADEVADMLFKQQVMGRTAEELRQQGEEELAQKLEAKSAQDQMNAAMEQLKQTFVTLGTALSPFVQVISVIAGLIGAIVGYTQDLLGFLNPFGDSFGKVDFDNSAGNTAMKNVGQAIGVSDAVIDTGGNIITTDPADYLIATQDPGGLASSVGAAGGGGEAVAILKELLAAVKAGGDVILDGNKVGKNLALASSQIG
jgi:hypothetical protein